MGARSDWQSYPPSEEGGDGEGEEGGDDDDTKSNGRTWTIYKGDGTKGSKSDKETADEHVHKYVQDQLKRLMSPDGPEQYEDEIEV